MKSSRKFTTMEIGEMLGVNYTTVNNWIRAGKLNAYQTPGGHRRVLDNDLKDFLGKYDMPLPEELQEKPLILVVDDEQAYLNTLQRWFDRIGKYNVITTKNSMEALLIAGEEKPDLIILDILMPGMDGIEICKVLKSRPGTSVIKVLGISGKADPIIRKEMIEAGAVDCLDKTTEISDIFEIIEIHLKQGGPGGHKED